MKKLTTNLLLFVGLLAMTGCASEDNTPQPQPEPKVMTEFAMVEEKPASQLAPSRTAGEYTGTKLKFYWTAGDKLFLNDGTNLLQSSRDNLGTQLVGGVTKVPTASFWFAGTFSNPTYPLRYTGKNGTKDKVTIAATQTQTLPADASHIGESGDCGTATATKSGNHYDFTLSHKAAYLTFAPFTSETGLVGSKLSKIKITANKPLAGTFGFSDTGIDTGTTPTSPSNTITLTVQGADGTGFPLAAAASPSDNSATIVLPPGTYSTFDIEYTVTHPVTHFPGTATVHYTAISFNEGKNKKLAPDVVNAVFPARYLFSDGTTGTFAEIGSRTPIGLVLEEKTPTKDGTAIALDYAKSSMYPLMQGKSGDGNFLWSKRSGVRQDNSAIYSNSPTAATDMDGYKYTWEASGSTDGTIKGNSLDFPAFYVAGHWGDYLAANGITVSGSMVGRKWYLPALGEVLKFRNVFGGSRPLQSNWNATGVISPTEMAAIDAAFTAVGATAFSTITNPDCAWTSTETNEYHNNPISYYVEKIGYDNASWKDGVSWLKVVAFVHF